MGDAGAVLQRGVLGFLLSVLVLVGVACAGSATGPTVGHRPADGRAEQPAPAAVEGTWREFWGIPGETDVTYHDEYRITSDGGRLSVTPIDQDQPGQIEDVRLEGDTLHVDLRTAFLVRYQLRLEPDGKTLRGTATTPDKTVPIRWERIAD